MQHKYYALIKELLYSKVYRINLRFLFLRTLSLETLCLTLQVLLLIYDVNDYLNGRLGTDTDIEPEKIQAIAPGSCRIKFTPVDVLRLHWCWPWVEREAALGTAKSWPDGAQLTATLKSTHLTLSRLNSYMLHSSQVCLHIVLLKQNLFRILFLPTFSTCTNSLLSPFYFSKTGVFPFI